MSDQDQSREQDPLQPDSVNNPAADPADWGRRFGQQFGERAEGWGKQFGERAQGWGAEAKTWGQSRERAPRPLWSRLFWSLFNLPIAALGGVLLLVFLITAAVAALICGSLLGWIACGVISGMNASKKGWASQVGALLGFALGPIGLLLVRGLPDRG